MTAAWDRDEALLTIERLEKIHRSMDVFAPAAIVVDDASTLLRAADAEINRLRARVEVAERMAEALVPALEVIRDNGIFIGRQTILKRGQAALAAWDAIKESAK